MATVYVSTTAGSAGSSGERTDPVASITEGLSIVASSASADSELIIMDDGIYSEGSLGLSPAVTVSGLTIMAETGSNGLPVVTPIIQGSGSGASPQTLGIYANNGWSIKGITFRNFVVTSGTGRGVIGLRGLTDSVVTVENCTFHGITGSCININKGTADVGQHLFQGNTFYDFTADGSGSNGAAITVGTGTSAKKAIIRNNLFYDWNPLNVVDEMIEASTTRNPETIISHNTFGTSSIQSQTNIFSDFAISAAYAKFEYNIIYEQTNNQSFSNIRLGEANYNIYYNLYGGAAEAPFGQTVAPTSSANNQEIDPQLKGPLVGDSANYRLAGTNSPAFDAAIGSSDVVNDRTGRSRLVLDETALDTGIFDIGAYELTGLWSSEQPDSLPQVGGDFTINRISNADNQWKRGLSEGNSNILGHDVDQVPLTTAINGAVPSFIRKRPTANTQTTGKKG